MTVVSLDEHRARREQELDYTPIPPAENLFAARALLARLEGQDHVEPDHEPTADTELICDDCDQPALVAWTYGNRILCRRCRRVRIRAAQAADMPLPLPPKHDPAESIPTIPPDAHAQRHPQTPRC